MFTPAISRLPPSVSSSSPLPFPSRPSFKTVESALTAVASIAHVRKEAFSAYYGYFMPIVKTILRTATSKEARLVRGKAMECFGLIGNAVGREQFSPDALEVMQILMQMQTQAGGLR
jgi:hypothetical protein